MINFEETQTWPDRPVEYKKAPKYPLRDADGTIIGTFGDSSDITRRVLAEAAAEAYSTEITAANLELRRIGGELRTLLEGSPDAIVKFDTELRHVYVNPSAAELLGAPRGGDPRSHQPRARPTVGRCRRRGARGAAGARDGCARRAREHARRRRAAVLHALATGAAGRRGRRGVRGPPRQP
jgi:PAS domain-containing protein